MISFLESGPFAPEFHFAFVTNPLADIGTAGAGIHHALGFFCRCNECVNLADSGLVAQAGFHSGSDTGSPVSSSLEYKILHLS